MPESHRPEPDPARGEDPYATQKLLIQPQPDQTVRLVPPVLQPPEPPPEPPSAQSALPLPPGGWKVPAGLAVVALVGLGAYLLFSGRTPPSVAAAPAEAVPPGAQAYFDQAQAGDAHAMRMLGVMYYYGLNVPQDAEKGLYWYRKAAERGSEAAQTELAKLERVRK
ncbi:tetratricopeptide repeat protein [Geothrix sp. 21YS21S-4]|uniref:tetratricopeptide repeat protein n=1 Tax=Geothrix sp. 21YS21S-4 TaxID=3068889 RepID=UPI0027BAEE5F|nr:SEL1-like repeat protein [Geothrix sp. 21YS21S-4]